MRAIILAGGKGKRLAPYTTVLPKPLMPVGDMPIIEVIMRQLRGAGVGRVTLAVGYLHELLQAYFRDGKHLEVALDYSLEESPLGTVGPLTLIDGLDDTFLMMNGDILTDLDFAQLIAHHKAQGACATIAAYPRSVTIDFGILERDGADRLTNYIEKPTFDYTVSMGIYVFEPAVLAHLKAGEPRDFPDLVKDLLAAGQKVVTYPFTGYWLDMGRPDDYAQAIEEFEANPTRFLATP